MEIQVHPLTNDPTAAWKELSRTQRVIKATMKPPSTTCLYNEMRVVCMSDTHSLTSNLKFDIPDGDIFIHAGDFTKCGKLEEVAEFNEWIGRLPHKHKIVIAGNHELSFDKKFIQPRQNTYSERKKGASISILDKISLLGHKRKKIQEEVQTPNIRDQLTNCHYIEDEMIEIHGIKIYGTPWQPKFGVWAFNALRGKQCLDIWNKIPSGIDILVTHGPPVGHGDLCSSGQRAGCVELLSTVQQRVKPKYHVFGHIHEGYGITSDGRIIFVNASTCDISYLPNNPPIVFDIALPEGYEKK